MPGRDGGVKKMNVMQPSSLTHTSKELRYLPSETDTKNDHPLVELEGPWRADSIRSVCRCPNEMAEREISRWVPGLVGARAEPLCTVFLLLYHVPYSPTSSYDPISLNTHNFSCSAEWARREANRQKHLENSLWQGWKLEGFQLAL